jgi:vesicular inhibitory amino acid transporter
MPRVVGVTMTVISILFLTLASSGYSAVGCQISGNLLFSIYPDSTTGLSKLGFKSNWGAIVMAYLFMQLHITIAFSVVLHPAFFIAERLVLGMHQKKTSDLEALYEYAATPVDICGLDHLSSKQSVISMADIEHENIHEDESADYNKPGVMIKYITLRVIIIIILVIVSVLLKDHFLALNDFVGASAITMSCIILPIVFYLKTLWKSLPLYEKAGSIIVLIICLVLGCYVTYTSGKELFAPAPNRTDDINFPYCSPEFEHHLYYNPVTRLMYDPTTNFTYKGA